MCALIGNVFINEEAAGGPLQVSCADLVVRVCCVSFVLMALAVPRPFVLWPEWSHVTSAPSGWTGVCVC